MRPEEIAPEVRALVDRAAGRRHSETGSVMRTLAEAITLQIELNRKAEPDPTGSTVNCGKAIPVPTLSTTLTRIDVVEDVTFKRWREHARKIAQAVSGEPEPVRLEPLVDELARWRERALEAEDILLVVQTAAEHMANLAPDDEWGNDVVGTVKADVARYILKLIGRPGETVQCCDKHNMHCAPQAWVCCWDCPELNHPDHKLSEDCVLYADPVDAADCPGCPDHEQHNSELHRRWRHPDYEYTSTEGQRKTWGHADDPPYDPVTLEPDTSWERNWDAGSPGEGWERFEYTEESYWRRRKDREATPDIPQ